MTFTEWYREGQDEREEEDAFFDAFFAISDDAPHLGQMLAAVFPRGKTAFAVDEEGWEV